MISQPSRGRIAAGGNKRPMPQDVRHFQKAAECLRNGKDEILEQWLREVEAKLPAAIGQDCPEITDHIPQILERLAKCLSEIPLSERSRRKLKELAREHGRQRGQLPNYTLSQVIREYRL